MVVRSCQKLVAPLEVEAPFHPNMMYGNYNGEM